MKKIMLLICGSMLCLNCFASYPANASHRVSKTGGTKNPDGTRTYGAADESYNDGSNTVSLMCSGAGDKSCTFSDGTPIPNIIVNGQILNIYQVDAIVHSNILTGQLAGTTYADNGIDNFVWQAADEADYTFTLNTPSQTN